MGGIDPSEDDMLAALEFLCGGARFLLPQRLHGIRQGRMMLQVNADNVLLELLAPSDRFRCSVCNERIPWCGDGVPCPACHGVMQPWPTADIDASRYVQRIRKTGFLDLVCGEHTAQITGDARISLEENFKGGPGVSPINVLACSPTLEMGIDVGGLDAVVLRNVPPRPDNYAQRGGRAGRRSRVGVVLGYARSTPHDGYFFDKPVEMIAGEVPVPPISLGNRDVVRRHLNAIVFGLADPPLAGRMAEYLTLQGDLEEVEIEAFIAGLSARLHAAASIAWHSWEPELLAEAGFQSEQDLVAELNGLPDRVRDLFDRVRLQLLRLQETIQRWTDLGIGDRGAVHAMALKRKLLGIPDDNRIARGDADDRGSGHPMRRFAEFGILPGYEFPSEPCTLRLFGDRDEDQPIAVERRFGISQYQPDARVHARSHRWRVVGLDPASPWNPKSPEPSWVYVRCRDCDLRYGAQDHARCPRCGSPETTGRELPGHEFGGYVAVRDDTPVLEEEDRFSLASQVTCHPQWDGHVMGRFQLPNAWHLELRRGEQVRWINEGPVPSDNERQNQHPLLTDDSRGFYLCPSCGRNLRVPAPEDAQRRGRRRPARQDVDPFQHANGCDRLGQPPRPLAIVTGSEATTLRIMVTLPPEFDEEEYLRWGHSLGAALRAGLMHHYMIDRSEVDFQLEKPWQRRGNDGAGPRVGSLTFVDAAVGGTGFLDRAANEMHLVARRAIDHLDHADCHSACYRCLKSYYNQRFHQHLSWPRVLPDLRDLAEAAPTALAASSGSHDHQAWLDAFTASVGSPLEHKFLRLFEAQGLSIGKQVAVAAEPGEPPISVADFVVTGARVAIYVDGAAFHTGARLRRDRHIRDRLRSGGLGWMIDEFTARDLARGLQLVHELRSLAAQTPS